MAGSKRGFGQGAPEARTYAGDKKRSRGIRSNHDVEVPGGADAQPRPMPSGASCRRVFSVRARRHPSLSIRPAAHRLDRAASPFTRLLRPHDIYLIRPVH